MRALANTFHAPQELAWSRTCPLKLGCDNAAPALYSIGLSCSFARLWHSKMTGRTWRALGVGHGVLNAIVGFRVR